MGFLNSKKWHQIWHPGFASCALRFKNFSQKLSLSLSLSSLPLGESDPVFCFLAQSFAKM
jgi:hypothetical protein